MGPTRLLSPGSFAVSVPSGLTLTVFFACLFFTTCVRAASVARPFQSSISLSPLQAGTPSGAAWGPLLNSPRSFSLLDSSVSYLLACASSTGASLDPEARHPRAVSGVHLSAPRSKLPSGRHRLSDSLQVSRRRSSSVPPSFLDNPTSCRRREASLACAFCVRRHLARRVVSASFFHGGARMRAATEVAKCPQRVRAFLLSPAFLSPPSALSCRTTFDYKARLQVPRQLKPPTRGGTVGCQSRGGSTLSPFGLDWRGGRSRDEASSPRSRLRLSRAAGTSADGEGEPEQGGDELTAKKDGATTWIEEESRDRDRFFRGSHIMTGMQPSGRLHLGNFFAVVRPLATLQQCEASVTCLIGDLHATFGKISRRLHSGARGQEAAASAGDEAVFSLAGASGGGRRGDAARSPSGSFAADGAHSAGSAEKLRSISEDTLDAVAILLASGMSPALGDHLQETGTCGEPGKTVVAVQSLVPEHTMLATLLMGCTPLGWLERCTGASANIRRLNEDDATTKGSDGEDTPWQREGRADVGMRFYPLLMAADILAHDADYVLVGDDQCQHVEFTRQVGKRWNSMFLPQRPQEDRRRSAEGRTDPGRALLPGDRSSIRGRLASWTGLRLPRMLGYSRLSSRIGDLQNPTKKMSKSSSESIPGQVASSKGCVFLLDPPDVIAAKIAKAKTDTIRGLSYNMEGELRPRKGRADEPSSTEYRAACRNLLHLWSVITGQAPQDAAKRFSDAPWECFKTELTERLIDLLSPLQRRYREIRPDLPFLRQVIAAGAAAARQRAASTLHRVREAMDILDTAPSEANYTPQ